MDKGFLNIHFKEITLNGDEIKIAGYANVAFGDYGELIADRDDETIIPSGIELENFKNNPVMLYSHDMERIVGRFTEVRIDAKGLYVEGTVYKDICPKVFAMVKSGSLKTMSVGFRGIDARYDDVNDIFIYTKTELYEISLVSVPAQPDSIFTVVKNADGKPCFAKHKEVDNEKGNEMKEVLKALDTFKGELLKEVGDLLVKEPELKEMSNEEKDALIKVELEKDEYKSTKVSILDQLKEVELDKDNIEAYIEGLNNLSIKINSKLADLVNE